jgi:hypothetical protein
MVEGTEIDRTVHIYRENCDGMGKTGICGNIAGV